MAKKYQVFISSTFDDLKEHRDAVVKAVLQLGHLPVGMEMFNAGDQTQWETIKSYIDSSDYYLVILAHRYGSKDPASGLSYTEKEYDYAGEQGVPRLGFVIDKTATWPADKVEAKAKKKLDDFKRKVGSARVIKFWDTIDKLAYHVSLSLGNEITINPRVGWVRATEAASPQVAEELARLSKENKELVEKLSSANTNEDLVRIQKLLDEESIEYDEDDIRKRFTLSELFSAVCRNQEMPDIDSIAGTVIKNGREYLYRNEIILGLQELVFLSLIDESYPGAQATFIVTEKGKSLYLKNKYRL
jgi:hypothetical protein